ncbi:hypothetical protein DAMA08_031800 [Martiniozyma asiatica (nom. inval.)]|nr:hypothetical protein DAMA08_031800 [Martiniozyma asiatica]
MTTSPNEGVDSMFLVDLVNISTSSASSTATTTPDLSANYFSIERANKLGSEVELYDEHDESDTVIHYHDGLNGLGILQLVDKYIQSTLNTYSALDHNLKTTFEAFKFDIIANQLLANHSSSQSSLSTSISAVGSSQNNMSINLSDTTYGPLLHSFRPRIVALSLLYYVKINYKLIKKHEKYKKILLAVSLINLECDARAGVRFYAQMIINRTKKMVSIMNNIDRKSINSTLLKFRKPNNVEFVCSLYHFAINMFSRQVSEMIRYIDDIGWLWKYLVVYGLENSLTHGLHQEESKVIRCVTGNTNCCSCTWRNEPNRLLRALKYVKKISLCVIMSILEDETHAGDSNEADRIKAQIFVNQFDNLTSHQKLPPLTFPTRLLCLIKIMDRIIFSFSNLYNEFNLLEPTISEDIASTVPLDVVPESNEDIRIQELGTLVNDLRQKLDMIELGHESNNKFSTIGDDINNLLIKYQEMVNPKEEKSINWKRRTSRRHSSKRMSDLFFSDGDLDSIQNEKESRRRSSGLNFSLITVVPDEESNSRDQLKKTLEKLTSGKSSIEDATILNANNDTQITSKANNQAFNQFKIDLATKLNEKLV